MNIYIASFWEISQMCFCCKFCPLIKRWVLSCFTKQVIEQVVVKSLESRTFQRKGPTDSNLYFSNRDIHAWKILRRPWELDQGGSTRNGTKSTNKRKCNSYQDMKLSPGRTRQLVYCSLHFVVDFLCLNQLERKWRCKVIYFISERAIQ